MGLDDVLASSPITPLLVTHSILSYAIDNDVPADVYGAPRAQSPVHVAIARQHSSQTRQGGQAAAGVLERDADGVAEAAAVLHQQRASAVGLYRLDVTLVRRADGRPRTIHRDADEALLRGDLIRIVRRAGDLSARALAVDVECRRRPRLAADRGHPNRGGGIRHRRVRCGT